MQDSWRNILERAGGNLSADLDRRPQHSLRHQPAGWPAQGRQGQQPVSFAESRDLLARELEAVMAPPARARTGQPSAPNPAAAKSPRPAITQAVRPAMRETQAPPAQEAAPGRSVVRSLVPLAISVAIVALTGYAILSLLR